MKMDTNRMDSLMGDKREEDQRTVHVFEFENHPKGPWIGVRHLVIFLIFLAALVQYAMRVNLSIAIVNMSQDDCAAEKIDFGNTTTANCDSFEWDEQLKYVILSSFFWGYVVLQIPSGLLAQKFGVKWLLFLSVGISALGTVLTPAAAYILDWGGVCAVRFIEGLAQGALFPCIHAVLASWAPPEERGFLASFAFSGSQIGTVLTFPISGLLADSSAGWPAIFYLFGGIGFLWCLLWCFLVSNKPSNHMFISEAEKQYIQRSVALKEKQSSFKTPWNELLRSIPMWAILLAHCAQNWGFWILMTGIPTYMSDVLKKDIKENGVLSALPYLAMAVLSYVFGWIQDCISRSNRASLSASRKIFNTVGFWGPAAALTYLSFVTEEEATLAVILLILAVGLNGGVYVGFQVNHIDLSPNFASTMMAITNSISNLFSIVGPLLVGYIGTGTDSSEQWKLVFWITAAVYFIGNVLFILMGSAERQVWDDPDYSRSKSNKQMS